MQSENDARAHFTIDLAHVLIRMAWIGCSTHFPLAEQLRCQSADVFFAWQSVMLLGHPIHRVAKESRMLIGRAEKGCPISKYIWYANVFSVNYVGDIDAIKADGFRESMMFKCTRADVFGQLPGITVK